MHIFCHTGMILKIVLTELQSTLRRLAGATRTRTCLDSSSINTMTRRSPRHRRARRRLERQAAATVAEAGLKAVRDRNAFLGVELASFRKLMCEEAPAKGFVA